MRRPNYHSYPELKKHINEIRQRVGKKESSDAVKFVNALLACGFTDKDICFHWNDGKFLHVSLCDDSES